MKKVIVSILTVVLSIPLFLSTPLANTVSQSTTTGYGSYYFTYNNDLDTFLLTLGNLGGVNMKGYCQSLIYEFNDTYSGYLDIHLLSESIWNNATIITENCYVKGKNSAQWDYSIGFKDVTSIKVTVVLPTLTSNNAWSGNKMALTSNYNITRDVTTVQDYLEDINTTLGTIDAQLGTMTTSLSNLYGVENASRQLLAEIEHAIRGDNSLYVLSDDMGTIITDLNSIISNINNVNTNIQNLITQNSISGYSLSAMMLMQSYGYTMYYDSDINYPYYQATNVPISQNIGTFYMDSGTEISFIFATTPYSFNTTSIASWYSTMNRTNFSYQLLNQLGRYYIYKVNFKNNGNGYDYVGIKFNQNYRVYPIYLGLSQNIPVNVNALSRIFIDDRYTSKLQGIIDAVNNMSLNVNQLTVNATGITYNVNNTQVDNSVTTYNTNINQVYNIENNFGTQLDTQLQNYNPDNTTIISRLTASGNIMATVLNGINGIELFTVPIAVMLVGIVLLAIVG